MILDNIFNHILLYELISIQYFYFNYIYYIINNILYIYIVLLITNILKYIIC